MMHKERQKVAAHDSANELFKLFQDVKALAENPPTHLHSVYLIAQTQENQASVLGWAAKCDGHILVPCFEDVQKVCGYPGASAWKQDLISRGVEPRRIHSLPGALVKVGDRLTFHSLSEQIDLALYAKANGLAKIGFVAPYFQFLRSFMSAVTACKRENPNLKVYPIAGYDLPWNEDTIHSQGTLMGRRIDLMVAEAWRIIEYQEKGDLPRVAEVREYLKRLD